MAYKTTRSPRQRPNYGIDAPGLVRGFFLGGAALLALDRCINMFRFPSRALAAGIALFAKLAAAYSFGMGCYMVYGSLFGKVSERHRQLALVPWSGNETVLDVGCGRGLLLMAAAKRVPSGRVVGIDIWQAHDQSGNKPQAALANARAEGVADILAQFVKTAILPVIRAVLSFHSGVMLATRLLSAGGKPSLIVSWPKATLSSQPWLPAYTLRRASDNRAPRVIGVDCRYAETD